MVIRVPYDNGPRRTLGRREETLALPEKEKPSCTTCFPVMLRVILGFAVITEDTAGREATCCEKNLRSISVQHG